MRLLLVLLLISTGLPAAAKLPVEQARIVRTLPHDPAAYTEGLLIRDGWLYESTGQVGRSVIQKKALATGQAVQGVTVPPPYFGEGIVDWKNRLYSFVWHGGQGFIWTLPGLKPAGKWTYSGEGWGMTHDGRSVIMSDGTSVLRMLDPKTMKVVRRLTVTAEGEAVSQLNELEYVRGEIWANIWQTQMIARIDPGTGKVKGWVDVSALWQRAGTNDPEAVPNGIAFDRATGRLYVTGKNWPMLFEIKLPGSR